MKCVLDAISPYHQRWSAVRSSADVDANKTGPNAAGTYFQCASSEEALNPKRLPNPLAFTLRENDEMFQCVCGTLSVVEI